MGLILNPGSRKRFLLQLVTLLELVHNNADRDTLMFRTAELLPPIVNEFAYYDPAIDTPAKKRKKQR